MVLESETICFDEDLAISMATGDGAHCTWVGVYALDAEGRSLQDSALFSVGSLDQRRPSGSVYGPVRGAENCAPPS
ncbi:hypothetical protein ABLE93_05875 [Xanthobacter sp. KR7-65]|uniref:hypothetical protein n=1 Tax=Xanthobacter sp. KR7-65 TaxID=3156612 RepID=UPI0032B4C031